MTSAGTVTFGECAENHVGMQKLGAAAAQGLTLHDLVMAKDRFADLGGDCKIIHLVSAGGVEGAFEDITPDPAYVLVVRRGVQLLLRHAGVHLPPGVDVLQVEHEAFEADKKALMRGVVVNKRARWNLCFADEEQEPDYESGCGRVVAFRDVPFTKVLRDSLPLFFGEKARGLFAEGNYYYDIAKCGIGFHGDAERRIVIAARFGAAIPLHYQWFHRSVPIGKRIPIQVGPGDLYAMSSKAAGTDWKRRSIPTLRHAAGAEKYLRTERQ